VVVFDGEMCLLFKGASWTSAVGEGGKGRRWMISSPSGHQSTLEKSLSKRSKNKSRMLLNEKHSE